MQSKAKTVKEYFSSLPRDRRSALEKLRSVILKNLPKGYEEMMLFGYVTYVVPLKTVPKTYNGYPLCYAALANQKNHMAVYLMNVYATKDMTEWFKKEYGKSGKKLDMGKSCVRFKRLGDLPLDVIGKAIAKTTVDKFVAVYHNTKAKTEK